MALNFKFVPPTPPLNNDKCEPITSWRLASVVQTVIALCLLSIMLVGCGGDNENPIPTPITAPTKVPSTQAEKPTSTFTPTPIVIDGTRIDLDLGDFYIRSDKSSEISGDITFVAKNVGSIEHELLVVKTHTPAGSLPLKGAEVDERSIGEIMARINPEELGAGEYSQISTTLESGVYALICNIPGHYSSGMYASLIIN